jgi:hypothetical protein
MQQLGRDLPGVAHRVLDVVDRVAHHRVAVVLGRRLGVLEVGVEVAHLLV